MCKIIGYVLVAFALFLIASPSAGQETPGPVKKGLIAYFPFDDGNPNDRTGKLAATYVNGAAPCADRFDRASSAYCFNGDGDYLRVAHSDILQPTVAVSVSAWIRPESLPGAAYIVSKGTDPLVGWYGLIHGNGAGLPDPGSSQVADFAIRPVEYAGLLPPYTESHTELEIGAWYHLVGTYDGATVRLYVNGRLDDERPALGTLGANAGDLTIGYHDLGGYTYYFQGAIDEIRIYSRSLSAHEVGVLYLNRRR